MTERPDDLGTGDEQGPEPAAQGPVTQQFQRFQDAPPPTSGSRSTLLLAAAAALVVVVVVLYLLVR